MSKVHPINLDKNAYMDQPPQRSAEPDSYGISKRADHKTWAGKNTFFCNGRCVSGPMNLVWPSIIVYMILISVAGMWGGICMPFLMKEENPDFAEPEVAVISVDFFLLLLSVLTIITALKT